MNNVSIRESEGEVLIALLFSCKTEANECAYDSLDGHVHFMLDNASSFIHD